MLILIMMNIITIVILTYKNGRRAIPRCLQLLRQERGELRVVARERVDEGVVKGGHASLLALVGALVLIIIILFVSFSLWCNIW